MKSRPRIAWTRLFCAGALVAGAACGSDEPAPAEQRAPLAANSHQDGSNQPPVVQVRIEPEQPIVGDRLRAGASVRDAEGDSTTLAYRWSVDGVDVAESGQELDLAGVPKGASIEVQVTANDGLSDSEPASAQVWVIDRAPVINGLAIAPPKSVYPGDSVVVTPTGSDPDGDLVDFEFTWFVNDQPVSGEDRSFSTEGLDSGDRIRVRVVANDGQNDSRPLESEDVVVGSAHPEFVSNPPGVTDQGVFRYAVEARDPDGDRNLRYRLSTAPEGMKIDEVLGLIEWRPGDEQIGVHPVSVVVSDTSKLETTQSFEITVSAAALPASRDGS